jgi:membrane protease YdiL (CAAX protease family)
MTRSRGRITEPGGLARPGLARPLDALAFLLPLIAFSEIASRCVSASASSSPQGRVVAFHLLRIFFQLFGWTGALMPALAVVAILLTAQAVSGRPWCVRKASVAWMYLESLALALPLVLANRWIRLAAGEAAPSWLADAALGIGAGIYEELVFRLVLISVLVLLAADLLGRSRGLAVPLAVLIAALLFAAHHHPPVGSDPFEPGRFAFRTLAGVYLGGVFVVRGYGPAAGTHAAYNLIVLFLA